MSIVIEDSHRKKSAQTECVGENGFCEEYLDFYYLLVYFKKMDALKTLKILTLACCIPLTGCLADYVPPSPKEEQQKLKDEAIAAGSACRQAGRSIESCFDRYESLERSGIFLGWKEMDDYMRTNNITAQANEKAEKEALEQEQENAKKTNPKKNSETSSGGGSGSASGSSSVRSGLSGQDLNLPKIDLSSQELKEQVNQALNKK